MYKITQLESGQPVIFYLENEKLHIRAEKTKCYSSFGMIEFIEKALNSNQ